MVFLDAGRRRADGWSLVALSRPQALRALFLNRFFPSTSAADLRRHLAACAALTGTVAAFDAAAVPLGEAALRASARAQMATIAS